jgi:class 3 adenylate cyclase
MSSETVTVLFTDLVGSTALMSRVGEERAEALRREQFALLREAVVLGGGREVKNVGDGLMVVFSSASGALDCAVMMQQRLEVRNRRSDEPLLVRVGVSHGEADIDGDDYFGPPVVEAARLCSAAEGATILTTDLVRALTGARGGHRFELIGELALRGLDSPVVAHRVEWVRHIDEPRIPLPVRLGRAESAIFVGRDVERAIVLDTLKEVTASGRAGVVFVGGEPGIGKTALVSEVARHAHEVGVTVLYGRCDEELAIPYQPWMEALGHFVGYAPDAILAAARPELTRLAPGLSSRRRDMATPSAAAEAERYMLFAAVADFLEVASAERPILLVLDDLHWADRPTTQLLCHVATTARPSRLLAVATFREGELGSGHPLTDALAALHREGTPRRVSLRGLDDQELLELMERSAGHDLDDAGGGLALRDALLAETDGNPFFVSEILQHLAETGAIVQRGDGRWLGTVDLRGHALPVSVREVLARRAAHLGVDTVRVLSAASVIGREFDLETLTRLVNADGDAVLDALERSAAANLVTEVAPGRFSFEHALVEHALYNDLSATRRARLHRRVGEIIEDQTGGDPGDRIGELAHHWALAVAPQDTIKAVDYARRAGDSALTNLAPDEALRWYARGLELIDANGVADDTLRCALLVGLGDSQRQTGDPTHRQTLLDAAHLAERAGQTELLVRAALANNRGFRSATIVDEERVDVLRRALDQVGDTDRSTRAVLLALLAVELSVTADGVEHSEHVREALSLTEDAADSARLRVLNLVSSMGPFAFESFAACEAASTEALALARALGDQVGEFWACDQATWSRYFSARPCDDLVARALEIAERLAQPTLQWDARVLVSVDAARRGDLAAAERAADEMLAILSATGEPDDLALYGALLVNLRLYQGRLAELIPILEPMAGEFENLPGFAAALAVALLDRGDSSDAQRARALLIDAVLKHPDVPDSAWLITWHAWAEVAVRVADQRAAEVVAHRLRPHADLIVYAGSNINGSVADALGRLATLLGDYPQADVYFDLADTLDDRLEAPYFIACTQLHRAQMQTQRDAPGDREAAKAGLDTALAIARRHGFGGIERDALTAQQHLAR